MEVNCTISKERKILFIIRLKVQFYIKKRHQGKVDIKFKTLMLHNVQNKILSYKMVIVKESAWFKIK